MRSFARLLCVSAPLLLLVGCQTVQTPDDGRAWGDAELISDMRECLRPDVAMDPNSNAVAVWDQADRPDPREDIWSNQYTAASDSWGDDELIESDDAGEGLFPKVAMDPNGAAVAVWAQSAGTRFDIWSNRYMTSTGWGAAELIEDDDTGDARSPEVAMDANGNAVAVWQQADGERFNIWSNRYTPSGGWGEAEQIEDNTGNATRPEVAMDPSGNAIAVWQQYDGERDNIWSNRYTATTGGWSTAELIETEDGGEASEPQVAMDRSGNAVAVWSQFDGTSFDIWSNRYEGTWGTAQRIEDNETGAALSPQVAMDASGSAVVVWTQPHGAHTSIWSSRYATSFGWLGEEPIESYDQGGATAPQVAMAMEPNGSATAVWTQRVGGNDEIWSNRLELRDSE